MLIILFTTLFSLSSGAFAEGSAAEPTEKNETVQSVRKDLNSALDKIETELKDLEKDTGHIKSNLKKEWEQTLQKLNQQRDKIRAELKKQKSSTDSLGERIKAALSELDQGVQRAREKLTTNNSEKQKDKQNQ